MLHVTATTKTLASVVFAKAIIISTAVAALAQSEPFWHQVFLVATSAILTGVFGVIIARVASRSQRETITKLDHQTQQLHDVKEAVGATKRAADATSTD